MSFTGELLFALLLDDSLLGGEWDELEEEEAEPLLDDMERRERGRICVDTRFCEEGSLSEASDGFCGVSGITITLMSFSLMMLSSPMMGEK